MRPAGVCSEGEGGLFVVGDEVVGGGNATVGDGVKSEATLGMTLKRRQAPSAEQVHTANS